MCTIKYSQPTGVKQVNSNIPKWFKLYQNYPNPFNPQTLIKYQIPSAGFVRISIYNLLGQEIAQLVNEYKEAGYYNVQFDGSRLSTGIYIYKITTGTFREMKKMVLLK